MLELEVVPEHGLCSDTIEFVLGKQTFLSEYEDHKISYENHYPMG